MVDDWKGEDAIRNVPRAHQLSPKGRLACKKARATINRCATPNCLSHIPRYNSDGLPVRYCLYCLDQMHKKP